MRTTKEKEAGRIRFEEMAEKLCEKHKKEGLRTYNIKVDSWPLRTKIVMGIALIDTLENNIDKITKLKALRTAINSLIEHYK